MAAIKDSSTIQLNKCVIATRCPVTFALNKIGGRWKPIIINNLLGGTKRYGELKKSIRPITEKMLIQSLKELQTDGLINRVVKSTIPPLVEYSLTQMGIELSPVLFAMKEWSLKYNI